MLQVVLLLRLSPLVPFGLLNYMLGLTEVPLPLFVGCSWLGMLPGEPPLWPCFPLSRSPSPACKLPGSPQASTVAPGLRPQVSTTT